MSSHKTKLSVNLNKIALLRNSRPLSIPRLDEATHIVLYKTNASGITIHPRPDQRHIRYSDVLEIAKSIRLFNAQQEPDKELNIEGNPFHEKFLQIVHQARPHQCTLVPDTPNQQTSDHGWSDKKSISLLEPIIQELKQSGIRVSLFMDANPQAIRQALYLKPHAIELYTEPYVSAFSQYESLNNQQQEKANSSPQARLETKEKATLEAKATLDAKARLETKKKATLETKKKAMLDILNIYQECARLISNKQILVNAGHDLNLQNLPLLLEQLPSLHEVSIGHALIADSIFHGLKTTIDNYLQTIDSHAV